MGTLSSSYRRGFIDALRLVLELVEELEHDSYITVDAMMAVQNTVKKLLIEMQAA